MNKFVLSMAMCLVLTLAASADVIPVVGNTADNQVASDGSMPWYGNTNIRLGMVSALSASDVFVFELPVLPAGEIVSSADFAFSVIGGVNYNSLFEQGVDLYAVRMASAATVQASDFYTGAYAGDPSATAIEDYILYETERLNQGNPGEMGRHDTAASSETTLGAWIASMYASASYDSAASNYVFLRLSARNEFGASRYWSIATASNSVEADRPLLTITTIPEPATIGLLAIGAMALIRRRK